MLDQFYVGRNDKRFGPFSAAQLKDLADAGRLRPTDTIWREGMAKPVLAGKVKKLFPPPRPKTHVLAAGAPAAPGTTVESAAAETSVETDPVPAPAPAPRAEPAQSRTPEAPRKRRALATKGAVLLSQDGTYVQYRKKCVECGHEDNCRTNALITPGSMRNTYFCPKCRKSRVVELQGLMS